MGAGIGRLKWRNVNKDLAILGDKDRREAINAL